MKNKNKKNTISTRKVALLSFLACLFLFSFGFTQASENSSLFLVDEEYDREDRSQIEAFLQYTSQSAYFYVEEKYYNELSSTQRQNLNNRIIEIADNFDEDIYPTIRNVFGEEWSPGIDEEYRITILFTRLDYNVGGYFNPNDEYDKEVVVDGKSNEREMIYINPDFINDPRLESFIAHEFQHMITWNQKTRQSGIIDEIWINEGRSELASSIAEDILGTEFTKGNLYTRKNVFLLNYSDSLIDWNNRNYDYGTVSMFSQYLMEQFGLELFEDITSNSETGISSIESVLEKYNTSFSEVFTDWTIANYINNTRISSVYGYKNENLQGKIIKADIVTLDRNENQVLIETDLKNWSSKYYEINLEKKTDDNLYIDIDFNGSNSGEFLVPYVLKYKNGDISINFLDLNSKQDGIYQIKSSNENYIKSITFIPSVQKEPGTENVSSGQVGSYIFKINLDLTAIDTQPMNNIFEDGSLLKSSNNEKVYLIEKNTKRWITDARTFTAKGYDWNNIITVSPEELSQFPDGETVSISFARDLESSLVKAEGPEVYFIENGQKRWIKNETIFNEYNFKWEEIINTSNEELSLYEKGKDLVSCPFNENDLIKGDSNEVYLIENSRIRWVTSPEIFSQNDYSWSDIIRTTNENIANLLKGQPIK